MGYQIKALALSNNLMLITCSYLILFQRYSHLYAGCGKTCIQICSFEDA